MIVIKNTRLHAYSSSAKAHTKGVDAAALHGDFHGYVLESIPQPRTAPHHKGTDHHALLRLPLPHRLIRTAAPMREHRLSGHVVIQPPLCNAPLRSVCEMGEG